MFLHADSEDSDQTGRMSRLICVFAERNGHFVGFVMRRLMYTLRLCSLASRASLTADPGVAGSTPAQQQYSSLKLIMRIFSLIEKGSC